MKIKDTRDLWGRRQKCISNVYAFDSDYNVNILTKTIALCFGHALDNSVGENKQHLSLHFRNERVDSTALWKMCSMFVCLFPVFRAADALYCAVQLASDFPNPTPSPLEPTIHPHSALFYFYFILFGKAPGLFLALH